MVAGNGSYDTYLQEARDICTRITFTGLLEKRELFELYSIADIGIMPSLTEQCNYVAIEMMMHGLPMITTAAPGLAEMTEDGISSLQVPLIEHPDKVEMDSSVLAEKILYMLQYPKEREHIGENARKRYEITYSEKIFRQKMFEFYRSLFIE